MYELFLKINDKDISWLLSYDFTKENPNRRVYDLDALMNSFETCYRFWPLSVKFLMYAVSETDRGRTVEEKAKEFIDYHWKEFNKDLREYNLGRRSTIIL